MTIRTLVLSGGGGRGAFHAGVYDYLCQANKSNVDDAHKDAWIPDIVVGTSIGAVNGAAIAQGIRPEALIRFWETLTVNDVEGLPPGMGPVARWFSNMIYKRAIGERLKRVNPDVAFSPSVSESWPPLPVMPHSLSKRLIGQWNNLLDTAPLYNTLMNRLGLKEDEIATSDKTLLISATNVRTGEGTIFSNSEGYKPITLRRIIASCSIPLVYPWTKDEDGEIYWDGAVVANTPLAPAFDVTRARDIDEKMEVVVVMMTPWRESSREMPENKLPQDFNQAVMYTLDWALLASFRADLKMVRACNQICEMEMKMNIPQSYRMVDDIIVAPDDFLPVERIIDYDKPASQSLIAAGREAAKTAFERKFSEK